VRGAVTGNNDAIPVMIDSAGPLGTLSSSRRFKEDIEDMGAASHDLMRLRPGHLPLQTTLRRRFEAYSIRLDRRRSRRSYPDLVAHSADGQIETVKYQVLDSMLLNEAQRLEPEIRRLERRINEQHQEIKEQCRQNESLQERLAKLEAALASMAGVARVSGAQ
jgi:predicted ribosome quality control (RQC) complex YloA/Tae2 family protein